jgi:uncharacterized protein YjdB
MKTIYKLTILMILMLIGIKSFSQTAGTMTLQVKSEKLLPTGTYPYTPRYIFAVWITDNSNTFVKSLLVMANTRKSHLNAWNAASAGNTVDATTGATYDSAGSPGTWLRAHTVTWNAKNVSNTVVTDGVYKVWMEQTSANSAGPNYSISFNKSNSSVHLTPANQTFFTNMDLTWTPSISVTDVTVNPNTLYLLKDSSSMLTAVISPANATNQSVTWSTLNTGIATVSVSGSVKGIAAGSTKIIITTADGSFKDTCDVTVTTTAVPVTGVKLNLDSVKIYTGQKSNIVPTIVPVNATNINISWTTSNAAVATVSNGQITAVAPGTAKIIVTTSDGNFKDTCIVVVTNNSIAAENSGEEQLSLFPNPASTTLSVTFNAISSNTKIDIYKPDGTKVDEKEFTLTEGKNTIQVQLETLADGIYFISLRNGGITLTKPFLIER